ncbi:uncharacterized protein ACA1_149110 [Acanthamoeba castellanii str. Neff]|uniref:Uncharacterized protein n=1 Tax=Acanthamoeba castellanii (strain ATCC 30010 / Neff) TaxID=1257118 RepID=L8HDA7_ACACF|nr:uncharacterized protein ACA1_149110 [Acanthamoeba castellanii str. Neff]ELR22743.1 hypothetical protein ACA1_149110 [Acanthamoeba castellanii str. Neff]
MRKRFVDVAYAFFFQHLWLLTGLCLLTTLIGVLWGCIHNGHLPPEFPSPSDTGVFQPEGAYFTFGLFWSMIGLAATIGRHSLVFGTFLYDQRKHYRAASSAHLSSAAYGGGGSSGAGKPGWLGVVAGLLLSERDDAKLLKMGTIIGVAGACFGTMVAAFDVALAVSQGHGAISNLTWLRVLSVMGCWFCLFGIIGFRLQFVSEGGHQSRDKERVAFLIFWANLFEWIWLGLVLLYGFIVFYWDYYHSPVTSPYFGFSPSATSNRANPLVFRIRCEVQRPDDVHIV